MNALFPFDLFMVYIPECKQQLKTMKHRYHILHTLNLCYCFITLREPCNNQRPRCDITWPHVTNHLYHGFPSYTVKQSNASFNSENPGINITYY